MSRALASLVLVAALAALSPSALHGQTVATTADRRTAHAGRVVVELQNVRNGEGQLLLALFRDGRGFPDDGPRAYARRVYRARSGAVRVSFEDVPPGPFAISVHHDEDADFDMDTGLFGIPTEGYGFSRNAHAPFGPPDYDDCKLSLRAGESRLLRIRLRY